jgi:hypothetical protein
MHPMHPAVANDMIQARLADGTRLAERARRSTAAASTCRSGRSGRFATTTRRQAVRRAAGWWLVNLGFRLALPRHPAVRSITSVAR